MTGQELKAYADREGKPVVAYYPDSHVLQVWADDWRQPERWDLERSYRFLYPAFRPIRDNRGDAIYVSPVG